jgi:PAS domain S-box-containing protein
VTRTLRAVLGADAAEVLGWSRAAGVSGSWRRAAGPGLVGTAVLDAEPDTLVGYALAAGDVVEVTDAQTETRFRPTPLFAAQGVRSGVTVPIGTPAVGCWARTRRGRGRSAGGGHVPASRGGAGERRDGRHGLLRDVQARPLSRPARERRRAVFVAAPDGRLSEVNPRACELTGYDRDELLSLALDDLVPPDDRPALATALGGLRPHDTTVAERQVLGVGCRVVDVECAARGLPEGGFLVSLRDISERKALQAQLARAQKLEGMGALAGGVAHELNNALTVIGGCAHLLKRDLQAGVPHAPDLDDILGAAARAQAVTRQLLAFSRRQVLDPRVVPVNDLITGVRAVLDRLLRADVELALDLHADAGLVRVDPGHWSR